jgi:D-lactate dehydrogenase
MEIIHGLSKIVGKKQVITSSWRKKVYSTGWRYGSGEAIAVVTPSNLPQIWKIINFCVKADLIIIMQAANTGLTGGSTPNGKNYDRPIVIINTLKVDQIHLIDSGRQIVGFAGSTLIGLEESLMTFNREPHSVIGSSCIGASIVGGVCNNSGGALIRRGPAYTELSLYAKIDNDGKLILINELGIDLGNSPIEILENLQNKNYSNDDIKFPDKLCSDNEYISRVRDIDASSPARFNSDKRRLYGASGCAGKIAVFAVRLDTYPVPKRKKVFYIGSNNDNSFGKIRRHILSKFNHLPISGEYMHKDCYDITKEYCKDTFVMIDRMGSNFIPKLFEIKRRVDFFCEKVKFLPSNFSDKLMHVLSRFLPNHLPKRMEEFREKYDHYWIIEMTDEGIEEANSYFDKFFKNNEGGFFECNMEESKKALLHRFVAGGAVGRLHAVKNKNYGEMMSMDIALPRNEKNWFEKLPAEIDKLIEVKLYYGHLFCHVLHQNYILKKGVDPDLLKNKILKFYDEKGAEYPAEHNVGHEYKAKPSLIDFYKKLDPINVFNPGIGRTSKQKNWK